MPGGDRTGPAGMGPMTGRGAGYCAGYSVPGFMNPIPGRGFWGGGGWGCGWGGGGRGRRNWFYATGVPGWARFGAGFPAWGGAAYGTPYAPFYPPYPAAPSPEQEIDSLRGQAEYLEDTLDGIKRRIEEIEARKTEG